MNYETQDIRKNLKRKKRKCAPVNKEKIQNKRRRYLSTVLDENRQASINVNNE